jgi:hypothetical protein
MKIHPVTATVLMFACIASASCGSSSGPGTSSGLPRSSTLASLTTAQDATLCDWLNERQGGYGQSVSCPDGSHADTDTNQSSCVASVPTGAASCPTLTVGDVEDCANAIGTNICEMPTAAGCANVNACLASQ